MKYVFTLILWCLTVGLSAQSGVSVKTVTQAGTLHEQFQGESLERVRILKIKGVLNLQDLKFMSNELRLQDLDLSEVNFDSTVGKEGYMPGYLFERMKESLQFIRIPASVHYLGEGAFEGMSALQHVEMPGEIYSLGKNAFKGCGKLTIQGDEFIHAETIEDYAFSDGAALVEVHLGAKLSKLGMRVFQNCKSLMRVTIDPKNEELLFIPEGAFFQCSSLQSVDIPNLVKSIDRASFLGCDALSQINLRTLVPPLLADGAFESKVHPMSVYVNPKSFAFYKRSGTWRRFRNYFIEEGGKTLYVAVKDTARIKPTIQKGVDVYVPADNDPEVAQGADKPADVLSAGSASDGAGERADDPASDKQPGEEMQEDKKWPEYDPPVVQQEEPEKTPTPEPEVKPAHVSTVERDASPISDPSDQSFIEELSEKHGQPVPVEEPTTYFNSEVVNPAVSALTFYVKGGIVHIEAPVRIKQLTIIDQQGRSIFATKLSDTLYTTSISQASMRLVRAVYENGIETKRFR